MSSSCPITVNLASDSFRTIKVKELHGEVSLFSLDESLWIFVKSVFFIEFPTTQHPLLGWGINLRKKN